MLYRPRSRWQWAFTVVGVGEALIALILLSVSFGLIMKFNDAIESISTTESTVSLLKANAIVLLPLLGYSPILIYDALESQNTFFVYAIAALGVPIVAFASLQYQQTGILGSLVSRAGAGDEVVKALARAHSSLLAVVVISAISACVKAGVTYKLYDDFAWSLYKKVSADLRMRKRYMRYQLFLMALKLDVVFFVTYLAQMYWWFGQGEQQSYGTLCVVFMSLTVPALYTTFRFIRGESNLGTILAMLWYLANLGIFAWFINSVKARAAKEALSSIESLLIAMGGLNILMCLVTVCFVFLCMLDYHKGLRPFLDQ